MSVHLVSWFGILPLVFLFGGLPLGVPPLPEDPALAPVAPEQCVFYASWAGTAVPDPNSANQLEQLLAEPEVRTFLSALDAQIIARLDAQPKPMAPPRAGGVGPESTGPPPGGVPSQRTATNTDVLRAAKTILMRPAAIYVSELKIARGGPPEVRGGAVVNLGDRAKAFGAMLEKYQEMLPPDKVETLQIEGAAWHKLRLDRQAPIVVWGLKGDYLLVAVGDGELEQMLKRLGGAPPAWLTALRKQLSVPRVSTVSYVNVKAILEQLLPLAGPRAEALVNATGLGQVTSLAGVTGLDDRACVGKTLVALDGQPQGLLTLFDEKPLTAADLAPIPGDATIALAARLNLARFLDANLTVLGGVLGLDPKASEKIDGELQRAGQRLGFDIREDLIRSLGDVWCLYNSPGEGGLVLTGLTAVVAVKDAARLREVEQKLLALVKQGSPADPRRRGPRIDDLSFSGRQIHVLDTGERDFPFAPSWCLTDRELVVALFPQNVKAYLARGEYVLGNAARPLKGVPEVARLFASDANPQMLCYVDAPKVFELLYPLAPMVAQPLLSQLRREGIELNVAILPSAPAIARHLRPGVSYVRRTGAGIEIESRQSVAVSTLAPLLPMAGLLAWRREARVHEARVEVAKAQAKREDALVRQQAEQHARREAETERTWVSITENGDKPGTALVLIEKAGKATGGKFYILAPEHPRDFSKGKGYNLGNVRHEGKTIKADVSVIDGSSTTGTKDMHLTITLKETLKGDEVQAEVQEGSSEKQPIVFVREKGGRQ